MNNMKIIFIFLFLISWSFMISAPVVSKDLEQMDQELLNQKYLISTVKE